jgi:hypothetical protein
MGKEERKRTKEEKESKKKRNSDIPCTNRTQQSCCYLHVKLRTNN